MKQDERCTELDALREACEAADVDPAGARLLRRHANAVYLLPRQHAVVRVALINNDDRSRQQVAVSIAATRWLADQGYPTAQPLEVAQPIHTAGRTVTFWRYYPQPAIQTGGLDDLARLLRDLHALPDPPFTLPTYDPLTGLQDSLARHGRQVLDDDEFSFLTGYVDELLERYAALDTELGQGLIHGDARTGNLLADHDRILLCDWDSVSTGPRELDLIPTYQGVRYGNRSPEQLDSFAATYGRDITTDPAFRTLCALRDVHTLSAPLAHARSNQATARQLHHRLRSLCDRYADQSWAPF